MGSATLCLPSVVSVRPQNDRRARDRVRRTAAFGIAAMGVMDLASGLTPDLRDRLNELRGWVPLTIPRASHVLVTAAGVALVLLAGGRPSCRSMGAGG